MVTGGPPLTRRPAPDAPQSETLRTNELYVLCRCGGSARKPFCDGTHRRNGFDGAESGDGPPDEPDPDLPVGIAVLDDGPLALTGVTVRRADGSAETRRHIRLCRCGASANKPFCDGSHETVGFRDPL